MKTNQKDMTKAERRQGIANLLTRGIQRMKQRSPGGALRDLRSLTQQTPPTDRLSCGASGEASPSLQDHTFVK